MQERGLATDGHAKDTGTGIDTRGGCTGFGLLGGEFRDELVRRDPHAACEVLAFEHRVAKRPRDSFRIAEQHSRTGDVHECLVDADLLDERRERAEDVVETRTDLEIVRHVGGHEHRTGTQRAGTNGRHGRVDPEPTRLVGRRGHHSTRRPTTDDDGLPAQFGVPEEFNGHVERIHVDVKDRTLRWHSKGDASSARWHDAYDEGVVAPESPLSALPSGTARALAFVAILLTGLAGGLIGYALVDVQCAGTCGVPLGLGVLIGSVMFAGGSAIVAVLVLRALGEWREIEDRR